MNISVYCIEILNEAYYFNTRYTGNWAMIIDLQQEYT
jgi:hypothetical protein